MLEWSIKNIVIQFTSLQFIKNKDVDDAERVARDLFEDDNTGVLSENEGEYAQNATNL